MATEKMKHHTKSSLFDDVEKLKKALNDIRSYTGDYDQVPTGKINLIITEVFKSL